MGGPRKSISGGENIMWQSIKTENMGMFEMQELGLDHDKMGLF